ncbi:MAG: hypothetical protein JWQ06_452 [Mucilaginibacter sp.]|nr:hypothetical protein [Mucilaginibacter sp.]
MNQSSGFLIMHTVLSKNKGQSGKKPDWPT